MNDELKKSQLDETPVVLSTCQDELREQEEARNTPCDSLTTVVESVMPSTESTHVQSVDKSVENNNVELLTETTESLDVAIVHEENKSGDEAQNGEGKWRLSLKDFPSTESGLLELMFELAKTIGDCQTFAYEEEIFTTLKDQDHFKMDEIDEIVRISVATKSQSAMVYNNLLVGHLLLVIFTRGKYAWEIWTEIDFHQMERESFDEKMPYTLNRVSALLNVAAFENFRIAELLVRIIVCGQSIYKPELWCKVLSAERNRLTVVPRTQETLSFLDWKGSSISVIGADHETCDDFSTVADISSGRGKGFAAVCSDGVSACENSRFGSEAIAQAVIEVVTRMYHDATFHPCKSDKLQLDKDDASSVSSFASELFVCWEKILKQRFGADINIFDYGATLLFAFKIKKFITCGIVGDGVFMIKTTAGFLRLTDGFSSIQENGAPYNVALLGSKPNVLKLFSFPADDVDAILMGSDGVDYLLYTSDETNGEATGSTIVSSGIENGETGNCPNPNEKMVFCADHVNGRKVMDSLSKLPFIGNGEKSDVRETLDYYVRRFSRVSVTGGGGGDDCSLVYLRRSNKKL